MKKMYWHTFVVKYSAIFEGKYMSFALVHAVKVMADLEAFEITCRRDKRPVVIVKMTYVRCIPPETSCPCSPAPEGVS